MNIVSISEAKKNFDALTSFNSFTNNSAVKSVSQMLTESFKILDNHNDKKHKN